MVLGRLTACTHFRYPHLEVTYKFEGEINHILSVFCHFSFHTIYEIQYF